MFENISLVLSFVKRARLNFKLLDKRVKIFVANLAVYSNHLEGFNNIGNMLQGHKVGIKGFRRHQLIEVFCHLL